MQGRLDISSSVCLTERQKWDLFPSSHFVYYLKQSYRAYIWQVLLPTYISHLLSLNSYFILLSARWIVMDIPWPTAHEFNPTSYNNSIYSLSSSHWGHVHSHISEFNFRRIVVLTTVITAWSQRVVSCWVKKVITTSSSGWDTLSYF